MTDRLWNRNFILLTLSYFLICCAYYSLVATLPVYISGELHAKDSIIGLVVASYTVAAVIIRPFTGYALDRLGRKTIFLASLLLFGLTFGGYHLAVTILILVSIRFLHGISWGITTTANSTIAVDLIPMTKRGQGIGYFGLSATLGMAFGPVVGSVIYHQWGYNGMFLGGLAISVVSWFLASVIRYPRHILPSKPVAMKISNLLEPLSLIPSLNLLVIMMSYGGMMSFVALYGHETGISNASGFFLIYAMGVGASRLISGKIVDRKGPGKIIKRCLIMLITGFVILAMIKGPWGYYSAAVILGIGNGVIWPTFQTMVNNIVPGHRRGAGNSTLFTFLDLGMGLGMISVGLISQYFSIAWGFIFCAGLSALGLVIFLRFTLAHYNHHVTG